MHLFHGMSGWSQKRQITTQVFAATDHYHSAHYHSAETYRLRHAMEERILLRLGRSGQHEIRMHIGRVQSRG